MHCLVFRKGMHDAATAMLQFRRLLCRRMHVSLDNANKAAYRMFVLRTARVLRRKSSSSSLTCGCSGARFPWNVMNTSCWFHKRYYEELPIFFYQVCAFLLFSWTNFGKNSTQIFRVHVVWWIVHQSDNTMYGGTCSVSVCNRLIWLAPSGSVISITRFRSQQQVVKSLKVKCVRCSRLDVISVNPKCCMICKFVQ